MIAALIALVCFGGGVALEDLLEREGLMVQVDPVTGVRQVKDVTFAPGMKVALVGGEAFPLEEPVRISGGKTWIPQGLAAVLSSRASGAPAAEPKRPEPPTRRSLPKVKPGFKVCIDPGHGGDFDGCIGATGHKEKDLILPISLEVAKLLQSSGVQVVLTRRTDRHLSSNHKRDLQGRLDVAARARCDMFVSLHLNWSRDRSVRGFETFVARSGRHRRESLKAAHQMQYSLDRSLTTPNRGVKNAGFHVLVNARQTAILVELGFISNPEGERAIMQRSWRERVIRAVAGAILEYAKSRGH
jgi:N-acetylmuramoyl-L-alanine amidase